MICIARPIIDNEYAYDFEAHGCQPVEALHYMPPTRHYDPTVGRWLSVDPIGFEADANLCRYVSNKSA